MSRIGRCLIICGLGLAIMLAGCATKNTETPSAISNTPLNHPSAVAQDQNKSVSKTNQSGSTSEQNSNNIVDLSIVKIGDKIAGLTVKSIEGVRGEHVTKITFSGEIELIGNCIWDEYSGDGSAYIFRDIEESLVDKIPVLKRYASETKGINIKIRNTDYAGKFLPKQRGEVKARIIIDNYSVGDSQIRRSADLIKVIEIFPQQVK